MNDIAHRDLPKAEQDKIIADKKQRRVDRRHKVMGLRVALKKIVDKFKIDEEVREEIRKELLGKLTDIDISYEEELETLW